MHIDFHRKNLQRANKKKIVPVKTLIFRLKQF